MQRFWEKVDKRGPDECWPWMGSAISKDRRGTFWLNGRNRTAPSVSLELAGFQQPDFSAFACHSCDNPNCVNPAHLWWGDVRSNAIDASMKGRLPGQKKTHCKQGHPLSGENLYFNSRGQRGCRACMNIHRKRYRASEKCRAAKRAYYARAILEQEHPHA